MAFDGITVRALVWELREKLMQGRISKVSQPNPDEIILTIKSSGNYRLLLSANPALPLVYITEEVKQSPMEAPAFTMLLRKHLQNGRLVDISQPGLERIIRLTVEHRNELGDLCLKFLYVELMGKYSNIILTDRDDKIIDSIKRINAFISSVREVLPGKKYFWPSQEGKMELTEISFTDFCNHISKGNGNLYDSFYRRFTGIAPMSGIQLCIGAGIEDMENGSLTEEEMKKLYDNCVGTITNLSKGIMEPCLLYEKGNLRDFSVAPVYSFKEKKKASSVSELIQNFYGEKEKITRARQKTSDLRKITQSLLEKDIKKKDLWQKQLKDTENMDKFRIYGELLHTYGYDAKPGDKCITVVNYYDNKEITIPLNPDKTPMENARAYFEKYNKLKRTKEAVGALIKSNDNEIEHLMSVMASFDFVEKEEDVTQIKQELIKEGYIRGKREKSLKNAKMRKNPPLHFVTSQGLDVYVGRNNFQNDEITFKMGEGKDWWFHAKAMAGSHVLLKCRDKEPSDESFEEAARLAAYFSRGREGGRVEIDYLRLKDVKKPAGAKPGFVVYYTNYSMVIAANIDSIREIQE